MSKSVLITGGAGFIGSHLTDMLLSRGYKVRIIDNLSPQVHGPKRMKPSYLNADAEFIMADITDSHAVKKALYNINAVVHLAASVGVGQSMYQVQKYTHTNNVGTAVLLENLMHSGIERLVVASSMSVYGEGLYKNSNGETVEIAQRDLEQLKGGNWNPVFGDEELVPVATHEGKNPSLASLYALSKYDQEQMCFVIGRAYHIPTVALRFFNVYGSRQALSNPYTGVLAIFAARLLNNKSPLVYEDGMQKRDFVSVYDVCTACCLALECKDAVDRVFNIGSGKNCSILDVARSLSSVLGKKHIEPFISGKYRFGDIRHCFADVSSANKILGYTPSVTLEKGLPELAQWLEGQIVLDNLDVANSELLQRGLSL